MLIGFTRLVILGLKISAFREKYSENIYFAKLLPLGCRKNIGSDCKSGNISVKLITVNLINDYDYNTVYKADYNNKHQTFTLGLKANTRYDRQEMIMNLFSRSWKKLKIYVKNT